MPPVAMLCTRAPFGIAGLAIALSLLGSAGANAEVRISGNPHSMVLEAQDAPLREILGAFGKSFHVRYRGTAGLEQKVTGRYSGSLHTVIGRLLSGENYVIRSTPHGMDIAIFGTTAADAAHVALPPATPGSWQDGDGNTVASPTRKLIRFAGPNAPATWRDGDGNLIAPPPGK